jgi:hypothetical protein
MCDDCKKHMAWKGIDWFITFNGYLLCSSCLLTWVRKNRYHKDTRKELVDDVENGSDCHNKETAADGQGSGFSAET